MAWALHQEKLKGKAVYTNFEASFQTDSVSANKLKEMPQDMFNCALGMSEVHLFLEARNTQNRDQIRITYAISQFRKLRITAHWDSQATHKVEKRLMEETDILIHCENLGCGDIDCVDRACGIPTCGIFHYEVWDKHNARFLTEFWLNGPKDFYHLFNSEQVVMDFVSDEEPENE